MNLTVGSYIFAMDVIVIAKPKYNNNITRISGVPLNITVYAAANFFAILLLDNFAAAPIKPNSIVRPNDAIKTSATILDPLKKSSHHPVKASYL